MKLKKTLLAAVLALATTPAFATGDDAVLYTEWDMYNSIWVFGFVLGTGEIDIRSESAALVDQDQITDSNSSVGDGDNQAYLQNRVLRDAEGNIGVNVAAGVGNAQANDVALSSIDGRRVFASAQLFNSQQTLFNFGTDDANPDDGLFYTAYATDNVLRDASGNIGLNIAAGVGNAQTNALAASINSSGTVAKASADSEQATWFNALLAECDLDNTAYLSGNVLSGAVGNIGVNVAAGIGNAQHNGLAIAVAACELCTGAPPPPPPPPCDGCGPGD
jgi:hypothetical protein